MQEGLSIVRGLLSDETVTVEGRYSRLRGIRISPPALQRPHPPMWVGGTAPKAIERAASMGFHFLSGSVASSLAYDEALRASGRDPEDFSIAATRPIYVAPTREEAWEVAAQPLRHMAMSYVQWTAEAKGEDDPGLAAASVPSVDDIVRDQSMEFFGERVIVGTPQDAIEQIEDHRRLCRLTHLVCMLPLPGMTPDQIRSGMELLATQVMPHFRSS